MDGSHIDRRTVLKSLGAAAAASVLAGCTSGGAGGDSAGAGGDGGGDGGGGDGGGGDSGGGDGGGGDGGTGGGDGGSDPDFGGWFSNVSNYDGVHDLTGESEVAVAVGSQANGGSFGFDPAAIRITRGTTVVWEWTGGGGQHNVISEGGDIESELSSEPGHTFEHTFESTGTVRYSCLPHETIGMKGAVVVE